MTHPGLTFHVTERGGGVVGMTIVLMMMMMTGNCRWSLKQATHTFQLVGLQLIVKCWKCWDSDSNQPILTTYEVKYSNLGN